MIISKAQNQNIFHFFAVFSLLFSMLCITQFPYTVNNLTQQNLVLIAYVGKEGSDSNVDLLPSMHGASTAIIYKSKNVDDDPDFSLCL